MNFPGLDLAWSGTHHAGRALGLIRPWSLERTRAEVAAGAKVLVVATTALGDSLLTTPLLETLTHYLGRERVSLLVRSSCADLYRDDPRLHRVFTVRGKYRWGGLADKLRGDPHRVALLANMTEPDLVPYLWRGGVRGFLRYRSRWTRYPRWIANADMLRRPDESEYASGHAIENNLAMAGALGLQPSTHRLSLPQFARPEQAAGRVVLIHPGASRSIKRWPAENWAAVADALVEKFGVTIELTGSGEERGMADEIIRHMKSSAINEAGNLSLPDLARLQAGVLALLSGDTGPYHLAVALGTPTVTLFAPTDRGSSVEACGPHQADPVFHRAIQTERLGQSITTISSARVLAEATDLIHYALARRGGG